MKVYQNENVGTCEEQVLIDLVNKILVLEGEEHKFHYKKLCNYIRSILEIDEVIGVTVTKDDTQVVVFIFDVKATEDNFFTPFFDEEKKLYYIETEEVE